MITQNHILYHDVLKGQLLYRKCIHFISSDNYPHCPYARYKKKFEISLIPEDLILDFIEQQAITLTYIYMSSIIRLQLLLALDYAITIHRTQCMTYITMTFFCGRDALRALVQNTEKFDGTYLSSIAEELPTQELLINNAISTNESSYSINNNGYYHF
ncbi:unnamed protein product [Rotaria socialis]|uniref:Uncharacterized protein n=1 Tax=Rotaria socialis TaxID=392032 RepID=A0A821D8T2_9BILA|nr:unnamed protein product [Rotaria socialis]CAF4296341.1 unnamed protein product [Rotaria socialis]CAF4370468.1 unnamed protein product [Rotaria socialis]CAF4483290.1 unnamed protein product [Rotaria socialis]CAF4617015.1 unnamed protein product [Rotaria socialis]